MSNPMKYIKDLEAAGFERNQAEAQVQMVLDAVEGDLVTKSDFAVFQERLDNRFAQIDNRFAQIDNRFEQIEHRFIQVQQQIQHQIKESELRLVTRLGVLTVSTVSIAVALLTWLIKI